MMPRMAQSTDRPRRSLLGRLLWWLALGALVILGLPWAFWMGDQYGHARGRMEGFRHGVVDGATARTLEPRSPVGGQLDLPVDEALEGLVQLDADTPPLGFERVIDDLYGELIGEIVEIYPLPDGYASRSLRAYGDMRQVAIEQHYGPMRGWHQDRHPLPGMARWSLEHHAVAVDARTVLQDEACELVRQTITVSAPSPEEAPILKGLCSVVNELLVPWTRELEQAAIDHDIETSVTQTATRARKAIMELATAQVEVDGRIRHDYESKLFEGWAIEQRDRASIEVRGTGTVKSGFKMHERYDIQVYPEEQRIVVVLPRAEILSNTLVPQFAMEREGWWTSLTSAQRNRALQALQSNVRQQALDEGILQDAESRAEELVQNIYSPLTTMPGSAYEVQVKFEGELPPE